MKRIIILIMLVGCILSGVAESVFADETILPAPGSHAEPGKPRAERPEQPKVAPKIRNPRGHGMPYGPPQGRERERQRARRAAAQPEWQPATQATIDKAVAGNLPIVIYFPHEKANEFDFAGQELLDLSKTDAIFIKFEWQKTDDSDVDESIVPKSKLLSKNPRKAYHVSGASSKSSILITDCYGYKLYRLSSNKNTHEIILALRGKVDEKVEHLKEAVRKKLTKATTAHEDGNRTEALKSILWVFKNEYVGHKEVDDIIKLYNKILDEGRFELSEYIMQNDINGMLDLSNEFKGTDLPVEIEKALKDIENG